tara:strand:- start:100 stop:261 length:162 start_codon:yes stop_codon:yes gene_type:complete
MKFKSKAHAIAWVTRFMPFAVRNSKFKMKFPFISYKAHDECCKSLGEALFKEQ